MFSNRNVVDADQGWEDMDEITMPQAEQPVATTAQPSMTEPATTVEHEGAQAGQVGEEPLAEGLLEDDDAEGWEGMDDLPSSPAATLVEAAKAAVDGAAAAVEASRAEVQEAEATIGEVAAAPKAPADEVQQVLSCSYKLYALFVFVCKLFVAYPLIQNLIHCASLQLTLNN